MTRGPGAPRKQLGRGAAWRGAALRATVGEPDERHEPGQGGSLWFLLSRKKRWLRKVYESSRRVKAISCKGTNLCTS